MSDTRYLFIAALLSAVSLPWNANALTVSDKPISNFIDTHTYTSTPSTKPAVSFAQPDKAYKIAGVCFLGMGGCGDDGHFNKGSSLIKVLPAAEAAETVILKLIRTNNVKKKAIVLHLVRPVPVRRGFVRMMINIIAAVRLMKNFANKTIIIRHVREVWS